MKNLKYRLNEPYIKGKEKEYVNDVLDTGWLSQRGKHTRIFEEKFAEMVGVKQALAVQSGTAALHTALLALGVKEGDKVVVPNYTCAATITTVLQCGGTPVIIDVEPYTFGMDAEVLCRYLKNCGEKPKGVVLVHVYGFPARDTREIVKICKENNIFLLEDCAEAHGAILDGKVVGSFGDISCFSVRSEKMIGIGEGGLVCSDNERLMDKALYWANRAAPCRGDNFPYWYTYYYSGVGMNYLLPHLLGAMGRAQIENFPEILKRKRKIGETYQKLIKEIPGTRTQKKIEYSIPSYWLNIIIFERLDTKDIRTIGETLTDKGIEIRPPFWPLGNQEVFAKYAWGSQEVGTYLFNKGLIVPSSVYLADNPEGIKEIINEIKDIVKDI